jgi:uncharacterized membrane protein YhaH (DUF805 family)
MFKGRLGVGQYWLSVLIMTVIQIVLSVGAVAFYVLVIIPAVVDPREGFGLLAALGMLAYIPFVAIIPLLPFLPFVIGLQVRRLHDINLSGWWWLVMMIVSSLVSYIFPLQNVSDAGAELSLVGIAVTLVVGVGFIVLMSWPGTKGPNKYGEPYRYPSLWAAICGKKIVLEMPMPPVPATPAQ